MKFKTTRKAIVSGTPSSRLVCAGYCELQNLLCNHEPVAFTRGVYGWNFDVYEVYGLTICTGYRNMPGRHANNCGKYEEHSDAIRNDYNKPWDQRMEEIENLLREFCKQA